ncbi:MAG: hypothetical protein RBS99_11890 [Rhodospirillales bacterium]|jgi:hypothetical protein|nr:hypothetical protein [Rhodospirillales bacterium]
MKITMNDVRACGMCSSGARAFFARHGLDWRDFLQNGIDADTVAATGDAMALTVVERVNGRK